jgi:hypothetical protein
MGSSIHRGDFGRARQSINIARIELESLEPRMQLAYKLGQVPATTAADISLARLMVEELDGLLRAALDRAIGVTGKYYAVYADATYDKRRLAEPQETLTGGTT